MLLGVQAFGQTGTIKRVVRNSRTNERLPFATVFINYTTLGTSADERGEFTLKNIPLGQHELVVTFVDHASNYEMAKFDQIKMKGFSSSKKFYSPDYSNPGNQARADYRATIYWNPFVRTNENNQAQISFYAADLATQYRIVVEGITNDGRIVHGEKLITIEERP